MPTKRIPMRKLTEVLRLKCTSDLGHAAIGRVVGLSKGAVSKYVSLAKANGVCCWPLPEGMDEEALEKRLFAAAEAPSRFVEPDYPRLHQELKRKGVTLQLLWSEYVAAHGDQAYRYSQFCYHYDQWRRHQSLSMRQVHRAGEKLFVDYCGPTIPVVDPSSGESRPAQVFVAVLGASSYTYAEATWSQQLPDWIASHQRAFAYFGGVSALLVPDNLRSAISRPCRYEPQPNATYQEMAVHYATAILPARPRKPKDKAKAEAGVQLVERWIMAVLRHQTFCSLFELNQAIRELLERLNTRCFQRQSYSRRDLFEQLDRPALKPLPPEPYEYAEWKVAKPGIDYHVEVEGRFYSVPFRLVGQRLEVRITATSVEVLHKGQRVAVHQRGGRERFSTLSEHMPSLHRAHREWSPGRFLAWAADIGVSTAQVIKHQLENRPHPEHGYRACLGLLSLSKRYGKARLEAACQRALSIHSPSYQSVSSILKSGLDRQAPESPDTAEGLPRHHANVRGPDYYH